RTYQLSWRPNETNLLDERNFSHAQVRRLPAEVAYDALVLATANSDRQQNLHEDLAAVRGRAIGVSSGYSRGYDGSYGLQLFGKPEGAVSYDGERSNEPSLLQTVYLRNDGEVLNLSDHQDGWLRQTTNRSSSELADQHEQLVRDA